MSKNRAVSDQEERTTKKTRAIKHRQRTKNLVNYDDYDEMLDYFK